MLATVVGGDAKPCLDCPDGIRMPHAKFDSGPTKTVAVLNAAVTSEAKRCKTIPKQIQNNVLFQTVLHVKQNTETIPKRFGIVSELFGLISIFIRTSKNMQIPKQF